MSSDKEDDVAAVKFLVESTFSYMGSNDLDNFISLMADDIIFLPPNMLSLYGKSAVKELLRPWFETLKMTHEIGEIEIKIDSDLAYVRIEYKDTYWPIEGGESTMMDNKGLWILRRESDGTWKMIRNMWNRNQPKEEEYMPKVNVNDIEMHYEVYGEGEPVVFLHGFSATNQMWEPFIPEFKEHFRLIVPDMRGHGHSTNPLGEFTHRQSALDIYALLDHLDVGRFRAVGYSSGGMTLIHMATQQPERVTDLVLISATPYFPEECREAFRAMDGTQNDDWGERAYLHQHGTEQIEQLRLQFHRWKDSYDDMNFTPPYLSTIKARTLIVHGDRDPFFPVLIPVTMYDSIPDSYLWIIPNMGHGVAWPPAEGLVRTTLDFLRRD